MGFVELACPFLHQHSQTGVFRRSGCLSLLVFTFNSHCDLDFDGTWFCRSKVENSFPISFLSSCEIDESVHLNLHAPGLLLGMPVCRYMFKHTRVQFRLLSHNISSTWELVNLGILATKEPEKPQKEKMSGDIGKWPIPLPNSQLTCARGAGWFCRVAWGSNCCGRSSHEGWEGKETWVKNKTKQNFISKFGSFKY